MQVSTEDSSSVTAPPPRQLRTVKELARRTPAFSEASLRNLIFMAEARETQTGAVPGNGLAPAIIRVGRKVLIDEGRFFEWLESKAATAAAPSLKQLRAKRAALEAQVGGPFDAALSRELDTCVQQEDQVMEGR